MAPARHHFEKNKLFNNLKSLSRHLIDCVSAGNTLYFLRIPVKYVVLLYNNPSRHGHFSQFVG